MHTHSSIHTRTHAHKRTKALAGFTWDASAWAARRLSGRRRNHRLSVSAASSTFPSQPPSPTTMTTSPRTRRSRQWTMSPPCLKSECINGVRRGGCGRDIAQTHLNSPHKHSPTYIPAAADISTSKLARAAEAARERAASDAALVCELETRALTNYELLLGRKERYTPVGTADRPRAHFPPHHRPLIQVNDSGRISNLLVACGIWWVVWWMVE